MIRLLNRWIRRALVLALGAFTVWLIVFVIFRTADNRLPWIVAVALTYVVAAYVVLPRTVPMSKTPLGLAPLPLAVSSGFSTAMPAFMARAAIRTSGT